MSRARSGAGYHRFGIMARARSGHAGSLGYGVRPVTAPSFPGRRLASNHIVGQSPAVGAGAVIRRRHMRFVVTSALVAVSLGGCGHGQTERVGARETQLSPPERDPRHHDH
jgi:hypothetical protein